MTEGEVPFRREDWSTVERGLFDCALEFYGAANAVIDYSGPGRPRLRYDPLGLQAVRDAMGVLEERVRAAGADGVALERIVRITRLERDIVEQILLRRRGDR